MLPVDPLPGIELDSVLRRARAACARAGERLTPLRREVLVIVANAERPLGAYEIAAACRARSGRLVYPSSVYRVLQFWRGIGTIAYLKGRHAFVASRELPARTTPLVFVCTACGRIAQHGDRMASSALSDAADALDFMPAEQPIEVAGLCRRCKP